MKRLIILIAALMLIPTFGMAQSAKPKKGTKEVSPFVEGKQKVRMTDYDSIWKFTSFDQKKIYFCDFDYSQMGTLVEERHPEWGNFNPVMNYLSTVSRSPMRICAIYAINPNINDPSKRRQLEEQAKEEALLSLNQLKDWMVNKEMKNKTQLMVAQVDYRYWQGTDYFVKPQTQDAIVHVGVLLFFGTKKIELFHSAGEGAKTFADVKFFPNDATVQPSWESYLDDLAEYLKQNDRFEVLLQGYSDNQGTEAYCMGLSRQRCVEIKKKLIARGIPEYRIEVEARGTADPIGDNSTREGQIANNRVAVSIQ
ncbi:MAG: OmpA family protein [Bacteroidales bacterium]|nr:OmpA family protein [Bacteroidales bacterium]